jgi:hypothetical protein
LGRYDSGSSFFQPQYLNWMTGFRVLTADDSGSVAAIPAAGRIDLTGSSGDNNYMGGARSGRSDITILVKGAASGVTVALYCLELDVDGTTLVPFLVSSQTTTAADQMLQWKDLPPLLYVPFVTNVGTGVTLTGGGTR